MSKIPFYDKSFESSIRTKSKLRVMYSLIGDTLTYSDSLIDMFLNDISKVIPVYYKDSIHITSMTFKTYDELLCYVTLSSKDKFRTRIILDSICYIGDKIYFSEVSYDGSDKEISSDEYWIELRLNKFNKLLGDL